MIRPSQVDSQFIVPTRICFWEQKKYSDNYFLDSAYVLAVFAAKIMVQETNGMIAYPLESSKIVEAFKSFSDNAQTRC